MQASAARGQRLHRRTAALEINEFDLEIFSGDEPLALGEHDGQRADGILGRRQPQGGLREARVGGAEQTQQPQSDPTQETGAHTHTTSH